ncbi:hypothetical protein ACSBR1_041398 [Camellia fascicularis]
MYIEELKGREELKSDEEEIGYGNEVVRGSTVVLDVKRVLVGAGARALFYPTLLYNVVRNKVQVEFRWWDWIDEAHGIDHLVLPTRDYLFAPSLSDICQAVDFIHVNASCGRSTYVHCKAGRGRSTTIVICYLVQHKQMMPEAAYSYVKSIRPRVLLAPSQWQAVQDYYHLKVNPICKRSHMITSLILKSPKFLAARDLVAFDDGSVVMVTEEDLDGYDPSHDSSAIRSEIWTDLNVVCRIRVAGQSALARLSCMWLRCQTQQKISSENMHLESSCPIRSNQLGVLSVDIHVY